MHHQGLLFNRFHSTGFTTSQICFFIFWRLHFDIIGSLSNRGYLTVSIWKYFKKGVNRLHRLQKVKRTFRTRKRARVWGLGAETAPKVSLAWGGGGRMCSVRRTWPAPTRRLDSQGEARWVALRGQVIWLLSLLSGKWANGTEAGSEEKVDTGKWLQGLMLPGWASGGLS